MNQISSTFSFNTNGKQLINITKEIKEFVNNNDIKNGFMNMSILHTSASLLVQENADGTVLKDFLNFFNELVCNKNYLHNSEGPDDMPAHIRSALTQSNLTLSIQNKEIVLGYWQGIFLFEHRLKKRNRSIFVHLIGE